MCTSLRMTTSKPLEASMLAHEEMTARTTTKTTRIDMVRAVMESVEAAAAEVVAGLRRGRRRWSI